MEYCNHTWTITKREWSAYFNSAIGYVVIVIFLVLTGVFTFLVSNYYERGQADLQAFFMWHPWLYLVLVPAVAMRLWSEEKRSETIELLFTVSVTPGQAILGKFLAAWGFLLVALLLTLPVVFTTQFVLKGNPDNGVVIAGYAGSALLSAAYLAVGMFTSALTRNQVIAFVSAVTIGLFMVLAGFPPITRFLAQFAPLWIINGVAGISFMSHFESMQRGVIALRDILYFVSMIGFMLYATYVYLWHSHTKN